MVAEPYLWGIENQQTMIIDFNDSVSKANTKLRLMCESLGAVMAADATRFDDDRTPLTYTKAWWGNPDGVEDDEVELSTRKLNIIIQLTDKINARMGKDLQKIRNDRKRVIGEIDRLKTEHSLALIKAEKEKKQDEETEQWIIRMRKRVGGNPGREDDPMTSIYDWDPPEVREKVTKERVKRSLKAKEYIEYGTAREKARKERIQKEMAAQVYVDSECSRDILEGERVLLIAKTDPPDIKGTFVWTIDDKKVRESKKPDNSDTLKYPLTKEGIYDMQVTLNIRGKYNDRYTDQIKVRAIEYLPMQPGKRYPPEMEGEKKSVVNLPYAKYWLLHEKGDIYLTGFYYIPTGQKVEYKSEPVETRKAPQPHLGLLLTKSGTGYHLYPTTSGDHSRGQPYIITRMRGTNVEVIHRFSATWVMPKPEKDFSKITIQYKVKEGSGMKEIVLD